MPKPKKDKLVTFVDGVFYIETTVHQPGLRSRTIRGKPWIATTKTDVRMGCIRFTHDAMFEMIRCMYKQTQAPEKDSITHQIGNYGDPEDDRTITCSDVSSKRSSPVLSRIRAVAQSEA